LQKDLRGLSGLSNEECDRVLASLPPHLYAHWICCWPLWARADQRPPLTTAGGQPWQTWLLLGGRGSGKTRAGAEWVRAKAIGSADAPGPPARRIALIGLTISQVRSVMVEGVSGLLGVHTPRERPRYEISRNEIVWRNGAIAQLFAADQPDNLRGPQFDAAWCDEFAKWRKPDYAWDMLQFGLRLGTQPQAVITTTPRNLAVLKKIIDDPATVMNRSRTVDNAINLAPGFVRQIMERYGNTALGRQELEGEIVEERAGGYWNYELINAHRVAAAPDLGRIVVGVDPPISAHAGSDACGIVVVGLGTDNRGYVLADRSIRGREPVVWARAVIAACRDYGADRVVAETNQGGDLVLAVIRQVDENVPVVGVKATRGKWKRAEPVSILYAQGSISHVGEWPELEVQMCAFGPDGLAHGKSPDRLDALVWALTELMLTQRAFPTVHQM
jgi:phage terminase large subunit-like protein